MPLMPDNQQDRPAPDAGGPAEQSGTEQGAAHAAPSVFDRAAEYRDRGWSAADAMRAALLDQEDAL